MFETSVNARTDMKGMAHLQLKAKILVLDASKSTRELIALHLSNAGYEVVTAEDAIIAGKLVLQSVPDLIITDIEIPYMSGIEFVAALRADPSIPHIPVIFLTSSEAARQRAKHLQAAAYLNKPTSADRLLEVVALHVPSGAGR